MEKSKTKSQKRRHSRTCSVIGCCNGDYRISKWEEKIYNLHEIPHGACPYAYVTNLISKFIYLSTTFNEKINMPDVALPSKEQMFL